MTAPSPTAPARRSFDTLDGLRGAAALMVVPRHAEWLFGSWLGTRESFLAVDLFFMLSGYVLAHAYGERLRAGAPLGRFMTVRFARLYPFYLVGIGLGLTDILIRAPGLLSHPAQGLPAAIAFALLMLPILTPTHLTTWDPDGPRWTLFFELVSNLAYGVLARRLVRPLLWGVILVSGAAFVGGAVRLGTVDSGWDVTHITYGLGRVGVTFFIGVLLRGKGEPPKARTSSWAAWACVAAIVAILAAPITDSTHLPYELAAVLIGLPLLILLSARVDPGGFSAPLFAKLGLLSYAIYLMHHPLARLAVDLFAVFHLTPAAVSPWAGWGLMAFVVALAWLLDRYYDAPVRRRLSKLIGPLAPPSLTASRGSVPV